MSLLSSKKWLSFVIVGMTSTAAFSQAPGLLPPTNTAQPALLPPTASPAAAIPPAVNSSNLPTVDTKVTSESVPTPTAPEVADTKPQAFRNSLSNSDLSIFFTPNQVRLMNDALTTYEESGKPAQPLSDLAIKGPSTTLEIAEPETYPVFYLSSIAYRAPMDWSIWISGHKITSHKNNSNLKILSISSDKVQLLWEDPKYKEAMLTRYKNNLFAPIDPIKHKLIKPSSYSFDTTTGAVIFSLKTNQTFATAYMNTFEGFIESPALAKLAVKNDASKTAAQTSTAVSVTPQSTTTVIDTRPVSLDDALTKEGSRKEIDEQLKRDENRASQ
jgi:hypothetical protein